MVQYLGNNLFTLPGYKQVFNFNTMPEGVYSSFEAKIIDLGMVIAARLESENQEVARLAGIENAEIIRIKEAFEGIKNVNKWL